MTFLEVQQSMTEHLTVCKSRKSCIKEKRKHLSHTLDCSSPKIEANILITILLSIMTIITKEIFLLNLKKVKMNIIVDPIQNKRNYTKFLDDQSNSNTVFNVIFFLIL